MTLFHIIRHSPIWKGLTPERWRGLNEWSPARSLAAARMPGLDALEYSAMCIPNNANSYLIPQRRGDNAVGTSANNTVFHVGDDEPPVKKPRVENSAHHEEVITSTATPGSEPEIPQRNDNKVGSLPAFSSPPIKDSVSNFGADGPPCKRARAEHFTTAETFTETFDVINAHDTESKKPQRPHDNADSPPAYRPSSLSKGITQLTDGESPSKRAKVKPSKPATDTAERHAEGTVNSDNIIAASYDSLTVSGLKAICKEKGISIPSKIKTKSKIIELLSETFPEATDILGSVPLVLFTTEALQSKCRSLGLPTYSVKCKLIEQLESLN